MKKLLLFSLIAAMALPVFAQEEDVTDKYIVNSTFDEDLTFNADGTTKTIANESSATHSGRSYLWKAADGTVYCHPDGTKTRKKAATVGVVNGFLGQVKGWKLATAANATGEWVYFGAPAYGIPDDAVGAGDDGDGFITIGDKPTDFDTDSNKGALYLRAGWGGWATYSQVVKLPCAKYRLDYWVKNLNYANSKENTKVSNLTEVVCRKDHFADSTGFSAENWTKHSIEFTPTDSITITFGFKSDGGSNKNPFVLIDGMKLYKVGEADKLQLIQSDITDLDAQLGDLEAKAQNYSGLYEEIDEVIGNVEAALDIDDADEAEKAKNEYTTQYNTLASALNAALQSDSLIAVANKLLQSTSYPGAEAFTSAIESASDVLQNGNSTKILALPATLESAILAYRESQEASEDTPADYTFFVQHPWFVTPDKEPTANSDGTYTFPNAENYVNGSTKFKDDTNNTDLNSTGWYKGSFTDGDQRLNYAQQRTCWNAWGTNFTEISVNQDLKNLPSGYYKVSADLITQDGFVTDQHTFATSSLQSAKSDALTAGNWVNDDPYNGTWTTLTTGKVLVDDGKLTIGAAGTGANGNQSGWFCVTNFKLLYLGKATDAEIAAAYAAKASEAQALADTMHLAGDKAQVLDSIATYTSTKNLDVLNNGIKLGKASEAKYAEINAAGKSLPTVKENLASSDDKYGSAKNVVEFAYNKTTGYITSDAAVYTKLDSVITAMKRYTSTYADEVHKADSVYALLTSTSGKEALQNTVKYANQDLMAHNVIENDSVVNAKITSIEQAISQSQAQDVYEKNPDSKDFSAFIINRDAAAENGWTINKGNGNTNRNNKEYYDSSEPNHYYFDSWNGTAGKLNYYAEQVVTGLPNGTYTLGAKVRTSGQGACIFANGLAQGEDTVYKEIPLKTQNVTSVLPSITRADGTDSIATVMNMYGDVWANAVTAYQADPSNDALSYIVNANNGNGYGWNDLSIEGIVVKDHKMVIGMTTDTLRTKLHSTLTWFSVVDFTLTQTAVGDNTGWNGPVTGITTVADDKRNAAVSGIYTIDGSRVNKAAKPGLYIEVRNGKARKFVVK